MNTLNIYQLNIFQILLFMHKVKNQYIKDCEAGAGRMHPQFAGENN